MDMRVNNGDNKMSSRSRRGSVQGYAISNIALLVLALLFVAALLWAVFAIRGRSSSAPDVTSQSRESRDLCLPSAESDLAREKAACINRWENYKHPAGDALSSLGWKVLSQSPGTQYTKVYVQDEFRNAFDVHIPGAVTLTGTVPVGHDLVFSVALAERRWAQKLGAVLFEAAIRSSADDQQVVYRASLQPEEKGRKWQDLRVPIDLTAPREVEISFRFNPANSTGSGDGCLVSVPILSPRSRVPEKPNVLIYLIDALRPDHLGCYGYPRLTTPHIDELAKDSVILSNAFATSSWTVATLPCIFTGVEGDIHQMNWDSSSLEDNFTTLPEVLQRGGWTTWQIVAHLSALAPEKNLAQGFDAGLYLDWPDESRKTSSADLNTKIFPWLDQHKNDPFFLFVHTIDVHRPYHLAKEYTELFQAPYSGEGGADKHHISLYDASVRFNDEHFGRLMDKLKALDLYDDTLIILMADHGEELWDHPDEAHITFGWGHGRTIYDEVLHIPLIIKLPESRHAATKLAQVVSQLDLFPTICDALGLPAPDDLPGRSLVGLAAGTQTWRPRKLFHTLDRYGAGEVKLRLHKIYAVREGTYKYIRRVSPIWDEALFDIAADPAETRSIIRSNPALAARMRSYIEEKYLAKGFYLRLAVPTYGRVSVAGTLDTDGGFYDVRPLTLEPEDRLEVSPTGKAIRFAFSDDFYDDTVFFRVNPPDAKISLTLAANDSPAPRRALLGSWELDPGSTAIELAADAPELAAFSSRIPSLFWALKPQLYLYRLEGDVPPATTAYVTKPVTSDQFAPSENVKEIIERLNALGYVR